MSDSEEKDLRDTFRPERVRRFTGPAWRAGGSPYGVALESRRNKLRLAVYTNNLEVVETLLDNGVDPNWRDERSRSLLHVAACCGFRDVARALLKRGADPNARDSLGNTPLHLAACTRHVPVVIDLLDAGTDVSSLNCYGRSPVQLAQSRLKIIQMRKRMDTFDTDALREEIRTIVEMMLKYLRARNQDASDMEELALRLEKVKTEEQVDDQVSLLLQKLDKVDLSE